MVALLGGAVRAEEKALPADDLMSSVEQWAQENLDDSVLEALKQVDRDKVRAFCNDLQQQFQGTNVYALGPLKETATQLIPVLQQFEETEPFAVWLQTHIDYLDTANELQKQVTVTPAEPGSAIPLPERERTVWTKNLVKRPLPPLAQAYSAQLKRIFTAEGVPPELIWVAEVESSFNPKARSPAGAAGLFQLMPVTAHDQGLSSWPWDERYQPDKSAQAAAKYLRSLHKHFGDWRLSLAAYNAGVGRVDNLLKKRKATSFDAIASRLPAETQMFVPKVEATVFRREGRTLAELK